MRLWSALPKRLRTIVLQSPLAVRRIRVPFSSRGPLEHQSDVHSGQARAGQSDKYQKSMSAKVTNKNPPIG